MYNEYNEVTRAFYADRSPAPNINTVSRPAKWQKQTALVHSVSKRAVDFAFCAFAIPVVALLALTLLVVNPFLNPGPLFFRQDRMGRGRSRFTIWKFRTMRPSRKSVRPHDSPLEKHRITKFGKFLRKTRLDEFPNSFSVLLGDMSLVGPRPDAFEHANVYMKSVAHYEKRFLTRPGITGLAQVRNGYADTKRAVALKARYDCFYVERASLWLDMHIIWCTFGVVLGRRGS